jgi:hypothetical protein
MIGSAIKSICEYIGVIDPAAIAVAQGAFVAGLLLALIYLLVIFSIAALMTIADR